MGFFGGIGETSISLSWKGADSAFRPVSSRSLYPDLLRAMGPVHLFAAGFSKEQDQERCGPGDSRPRHALQNGDYLSRAFR